MTKPDLEQAKNYLDCLDLSYLIKKMTSEHYELPRWPVELATVCCQLYKNFLWLHCKYPGVIFVPTRDIDEFWHNHILYTGKYMRDCQAIIGRYLHHRPSDPDDESEMAATVEQFNNTKTHYQKEFGVELKVLDRSIVE